MNRKTNKVHPDIEKAANQCARRLWNSAAEYGNKRIDFKYGEVVEQQEAIERLIAKAFKQGIQYRRRKK
jgi:hypothetical protein